MISGEARKATLDFEGILRMKGRIYVPRVGDLVWFILQESCYSTYSMHLGEEKMYHNPKQHLCFMMKRDTVEFVARCLNYQ